MNRTGLLSDALDVRGGRLVSLTGGGGKTTALLTLAREAGDARLRVLASTTTKVGARVESEMPVVFTDTPDWRAALRRRLAEDGRAFLAASRDGDGKLTGVDEETLETTRDLADLILVEADGARQRPLKIPGDHEPVIPRTSDLVVPVAGLDALGRPIAPDVVHRPESLPAELSGGLVTAEFVARVLTSDWGGMKGVPGGATVRPILNKLDLSSVEEAQEVAELVLSVEVPEIDRVILASLKRREYAFLKQG